MNDRPTLRDRVAALRDRLLASPRFQRWATAVPFLRPIATRHARALFDLCAGFVYSQVLVACVRLRLFDLLAKGPRSLQQIAADTDLPEPRAERLLAAAASLRLVERRGTDRYGLGVLAAALRGNPGVTAMIEHHALLYADLQDPVALLRGDGASTRLAAFWAYARAQSAAALGAEQVSDYTALMAASHDLVASDLLDAYSFTRHCCLLDVGGGDGSFLAAAATRSPHLRLMHFDLPAVAEQARCALSRRGLRDRVQVTGGDFLRSPLPAGADVVTLVRVLHDHDDDAALALLRAVQQALPAGGVLLVAEPMAGTRGAEPVGDAYFGFYLLAMGSGRPRSARQLQAMAQQAGFERADLLAARRPVLTQVLVCRNASG